MKLLGRIKLVPNRLRPYVGERRESIRHRAQWQARLLFSVPIGGAESSRAHALSLKGFTHDLSESGLALVVPSLRSGDRYLVDEGRALRVVLLDPPTGDLDIFATPVRYKQLHEPEVGHLIGVRITSMSEGGRARLIQYLRTLH